MCVFGKREIEVKRESLRPREAYKVQIIRTRLKNGKEKACRFMREEKLR